MHSVETVLAPELQKARNRRRGWLAVAIVFSLGVCVAALEYRPLYNWVQGMRSRRMAAKAEAEILAGNIEEAMHKALIAEQTKPDEPVAIRVRAKTLALLRLPAASSVAVQFWKKLDQLGAMRPEDRRPYAEDLLLAGATADAGNEIEKMLKAGTSDGAWYRLAVRWATMEGNTDRAREFCAKAVKLEPENHDGRLLMAMLQLASGKPDIRQQGIRAALELGKERSREGLEAITQLVTMRGVPIDVAEEAMPLLLQHPLATEQHRILAFSISLALHPDRKAELLDAEVQKYRSATAAARCAFANWLQARGEYQRILATIPTDEAFKRQDLLRVVLDALAGLGRWSESERILQMKDVPLYPAIKELYLARTAAELGSPTVAELHWRRAHLAAGPNPDTMREIADYAERIGNYDQAELAFGSLSSNADHARPAMEGLLRIARARGDLDMLCGTLRKMNARWPRDDSVKNDLSYFNLIRGKSVDESLAAAKELVSRSPRNLPHITTFALALIRKGDPAGALAVYEGLSIPWERVPTGQRAVHVAALGLAGRAEAASAEAAALRWEDMLPQERELIQRWRKK